MSVHRLSILDYRSRPNRLSLREWLLLKLAGENMVIINANLTLAAAIEYRQGDFIASTKMSSK